MKKIFISYARSDRDAARRLYEHLNNVDDLAPWFDEESILPGAKWRPEIRKAIRESDYFLALVSSNSNKGRGVRHSELDQALDVLTEFPPSTRYLIPVRLDDCEMPRDELGEINWVDVFPDFNAGVSRIIRAISDNINSNVTGSDVNLSELNKDSQLNYHYRVALLDVNNGVGNVSMLAEELNKIQNVFYFVTPSIPMPTNVVQNIDGIENFATYLLPSSIYKKHGMLNADIAIITTAYPLAFEEDGSILYNYYSGPSDKDERFLFVSLDQLYSYAKEAGCTFEQGFVSIVVGQLLVYFTKLGYHDKTRGCPMDFCEIRHDIVESLRKRRFCEKCSIAMGHNELTEALKRLLAWSPR